MGNLFHNFDEVDEAIIPSRKKEEPLLTTEFTFQRSLKPLKAGIVASFVLSVAALIGAIWLYQSFDAEKQERLNFETGQKEVIENAKSLQDQVAQYKAVIDRMREQISGSAEERKQFKKEFEDNEKEISNLQAKMKELESRNQKMTAETEAIKKQLASANEEISSKAEELTSAREQLTQTQTQLVAAETTIDTAGAGAAAAASSPVVLSVNRKYNFAVVNLGKKEGLKIGDQLNVFREGKPVAVVEVEKLYDSFSAATIVKETKDNQVNEGDEIRRGS